MCPRAYIHVCVLNMSIGKWMRCEGDSWTILIKDSKGTRHSKAHDPFEAWSRPGNRVGVKIGSTQIWSDQISPHPYSIRILNKLTGLTRTRLGPTHTWSVYLNAKIREKTRVARPETDSNMIQPDYALPIFNLYIKQVTRIWHEPGYPQTHTRKFKSGSSSGWQVRSIFLGLA